DLRMPTSLLNALAIIKLCAADVNAELGLIDKKIAQAISQAAFQAADGVFADQFPVDVFQTGSGTSTNMNMNEVIATRAREILGGDLSQRSLVHPNDHVNLGQSSNDAIPTAIHIAAAADLTDDLLPALKRLASALDAKSRQFKKVIKTGRTHLQD